MIKSSNIKGPLNWDYLKKYHCIPPGDTLPRTEQVIKEYQEHIDSLLKQNMTASDNLRTFLFKDQKPYTFILNKFPYWTTPDIKHYLLWFQEKHFNFPNPLNTNTPEIHKIIVEELFNLYKEQKNEIGKKRMEYIYFENEKVNKSVPDIRHIHLFVKI